MITLQAGDKVSIQLTIGDRNNDGKVDLSIDAAFVIPGILGGNSHAVSIPTMTENLPVQQAEDIMAMAAKGGVSALSGSIPALAWLVHAGAGVLHLPVKL